MIHIRGARQNNLKNVDVSLPRGKLTVVTGVSGSGKSSLAFDTLYAEGQRRYVESFSTYARQFLERMDRPDVDSIDGLIPAIALEQKNTIRASRSTLGTLVEITDYLRVLFAKLADCHCDICGEVVTPDLPEAVIQGLIASSQGKRALITFPFHAGEGPDAAIAREYLIRDGFPRIWRDGALVRLDSDSHQSSSDAPDGRLAVIVDRLKITSDGRTRMVDSLELAYRHGHGEATIYIEDDGGALAGASGPTVEAVGAAVDSGGFRAHDVHMEYRHCGRQYPRPTEGLFSFNSPVGACEACKGFGRVIGLDMDRVVPDRTKTLKGGAVHTWRGPKRTWERRKLRELCDAHKISMEVPFEELPKDQRSIVLEGSGRQSFSVRSWFTMLERKAYRMHVRIFLSRYRSYTTCPDCNGGRFRPETLRFRLAGLTAPQVLSKTVTEALAYLKTLPPTAKATALKPALSQLSHRLGTMASVGIGYLDLNRQARTLSGGELQRANLTRAIGSGLVNTLFVLDEPTIGLHPEDSRHLADVLRELTERDNTVVLVEHDPDVLRVADHVIEMGPGPGADGGQISFAGPPAQMALSDTATTRALNARRAPRSARSKDFGGAAGIVIRGARHHNLKGDDIRLPHGVMTVVTGVSGSGKSTLVEGVLHRGILRLRGLATAPPGQCDDLEGTEVYDEVMQIDQTAPGASSRANPATYVKAWDGLRKLFASQPLARERGYSAGTFSFNSGNGRCPACEGRGFERVEMQFLADVNLRCELCEGRRFKPEVLEVRWDGLSAADVLELTIAEAVVRLGARSAPGKRLNALREMGLGYLKLGQTLSTLSGGEAQRLKLAQHLAASGARSRKKKPKRSLVLLDEPTTGLHLADVERLLENLRALVEGGHTVVVIEHHLDVITAADHVIDLGPEGGDGGGSVVFAGPPAALAKAGTHTGRHLARWLSGVAPLDRDGIIEAPIHPAVSTSGSGSVGLVGPAGPVGPIKIVAPPSDGEIVVQGARVHNLKNISLRLPRGKRTVVSGVSGSGKSSLAFDIVFAEGQRRFLDCLSTYARQYITQMNRPDADHIAGIPPTVAIEQRTTRGGSRSTVANVTEIEPFLRLLFARVGQLPRDGVSGTLDAEGLATHLAVTDPAATVTICAPIVQSRQGLHKKVFARAAELAVEVFVDGRRRKPSPTPRLRQRKHHDIDYVIADVTTEGAEPRGRLLKAVTDAAVMSEGQVKVFSQSWSPRVFEVDTPELRSKRQSWDPRYFSPRTSLGACAGCEGLGQIQEATNTSTSADADADGVACPECDGERLGPIGRSVQVGGHRFPELVQLSAPQLVQTLAGLRLGARDATVAAGPRAAISERALFLSDVGLGYLTLDRSVRSLSGGEAQRIRLAAQLGAHLSGVLYVLDEPTIGLHPTDTEVLLRTLDRLQARGNGILMVEHDEQTLRSADHLIDVGPGAGRLGGEIVAQGDLAQVLANPNSPTGRLLAKPAPPVRATPRPVSTSKASFINLTKVHHHNLKGVNFKIPRGRLSVITGVSGSGKSSLVEVLATAIRESIAGDAWGQSGSQRGELTGWEGLDSVKAVDDKPIGKNPRSTPATYVKVWDPFRKLYAQLPDAKVRGFSPSRFSFNVKGGRCDSCAGQGMIKLEMSFLPDTWVGCEVCGGKRFNRQTLAVRYDGHSIADVLQMSVAEALEVFERVPKIKRALQLLDDVGLGYLPLGQQSPTLSGGEAQRIKLVSHLVGRGQPATMVILDEPTIGLHMADVPKLMAVVHRLVDAGATVVIIEHNPDVMREADWIIDMGPGASEAGGEVVYQGPFKGLIGAKRSRTGGWLADQR